MTRLYISDSSSTSSSITYAWGDAQQADVEPNESFTISGDSYSLTKEKYCELDFGKPEDECLREYNSAKLTCRADCPAWEPKP